MLKYEFHKNNTLHRSAHNIATFADAQENSGRAITPRSGPCCSPKMYILLIHGGEHRCCTKVSHSITLVGIRNLYDLSALSVAIGAAIYSVGNSLVSDPSLRLWRSDQSQKYKYKDS